MSQDLYVYRFTRPVRSLVQHDNRLHLVELPAGSIVSIDDAMPDKNGMIVGTCKSEHVLLFSIDLQDRAELLFTKLDKSGFTNFAGGPSGIDSSRFPARTSEGGLTGPAEQARFPAK